MKSYTDIEQSKKLAKILLPGTADMRYTPFGDTHPWVWDDGLLEKGSVPCWSLGALLEVLSMPTLIQDKAEGILFWQCSVYNEEGEEICEIYASDKIDACVEMVIKLNELKLL